MYVLITLGSKVRKEKPKLKIDWLGDRFPWSVAASQGGDGELVDLTMDRVPGTDVCGFDSPPHFQESRKHNWENEGT